jgi:hypothetical protein
MVEAFHKKYAGRLTHAERAALVSWIRSEAS